MANKSTSKCKYKSTSGRVIEGFKVFAAVVVVKEEEAVVVLAVGVAVTDEGVEPAPLGCDSLLRSSVSIG